jgi:pilus assembly protein CpaB
LRRLSERATLNFMPQNRILITLIASSVIGLIAIFIAAFWLKGNQSINTIPVVAASTPIPAGTTLSNENLKIIEVPRESVPIGVENKVEALLGRVSKINIATGEIIVDRMVNELGASGGLAFAITVGMRAISMNVNEVSDVAGFVLPGNYVDVLFNPKGDTGGGNSRVLIEHALVLAVAQDRIGQDGAKPKVVSAVTLEVTPQQAEMLDSARAAGTLSLTLRNQAEAQNIASTNPGQVKTQSTVENGVEVIRGTTVRIESGLGN